LLRLDPAADVESLPYLATFSPDGSKLLMVASAGEDGGDRSLLVRDLGGDEDVLLLTVPTVGFWTYPGVWWSADGTVLFDSSVLGEGESDPDVWTRLRLEPADDTVPDGGLATPTAQVAPGAPIDPATVEAGMRLVVNDAVAAVRSAPSLTAPVVAELRQGAEVVALGPAEMGDGFTWIPVRDPATGTIGYVRAELLSAA
jgi:hypothetical protein